MRNAPDSHHIEIMLHGIKLPAPQGGNGMSPGVSDWGDTEDSGNQDVKQLLTTYLYYEIQIYTSYDVGGRACHVMRE